MKEKTIDMQKIMEGLGIAVGDIVLVNDYCLLCNEKFDLVNYSGCYNSSIPNIILGMVSGKYSYKIYTLSCEIVEKSKENIPPTC